MRDKLAPLLMLAVGLWLLLGDGCTLPIVVAKPTAATYIYEKDDTTVPPAIAAALDKLNTAGIRANIFEEDTTDGAGEVPDQYKLALPAAKAEGLPALVVEGGGRVLRTVKDPKTEEAVLEAAK